MKEEMQQLASSERIEWVQAYQRETEEFHRQTVNRRLREEEEERRESEAAATAEEEKKERELFASWEQNELALAFRNESEEKTRDSEASALTTTTLDPGW